MILKKWMPVLGKDHAQTNNLERDDDSRRNHLAQGHGDCAASGHGSISRKRIMA
jgi:hypothetical protein